MDQDHPLRGRPASAAAASSAPAPEHRPAVRRDTGLEFSSLDSSGGPSGHLREPRLADRRGKTRLWIRPPFNPRNTERMAVPHRTAKAKRDANPEPAISPSCEWSAHLPHALPGSGHLTCHCSAHRSPTAPPTGRQQLSGEQSPLTVYPPLYGWPWYYPCQDAGGDTRLPRETPCCHSRVGQGRGSQPSPPAWPAAPPPFRLC